MSSHSEPRGRRVPLVVMPLLAYVGVTVVLPAVNGSTGRPGFWEHAMITVGISCVMTSIWLALRWAARRRGHSS